MRSALALALLLAACGDPDAPAPPTKSRAELMKPETCAECHADHYREWSGSMHAYAAEDPVFIAMNRRGQEETGGALGDFCVNCHAPMAVREGATTDGLNLSELPSELKGVTCYFCHDAIEVQGTHNNPIRLAGGVTMRGGLSQPNANSAHRSTYSPLHDRERPESASLCGACHDIVLPSPPAPAPVHLERTFTEWQDSLFSRDPAQGGLTCGGCHMPGRDGLAADVPGVPLRRVHGHDFPAVDVALTPFPERSAQLEAVQRELDTTLRAEICVVELPGATTLEVLLENVAAGHRWPSGAAHDRRAWVELRAFEQGVAVYESGVVPEGTAITDLADPDLWLLRDRATDAQGQPAHMFWEIAKVESDTIPAPVTFDPSHPDYFLTHVKRRYPRATSTPNQIAAVVDRVTLRVRLRPVGLDVLQDLIDSKHLDASVVDAMPTFDLLPNRGASDVSLEWTIAAAQDPKLGFQKLIDGLPARCVTSAKAVSSTN